MKNDIIKSDNFITEASDLSGNMLGISISANGFINENMSKVASTHTAGIIREYANILAELVKRETIARMQRSLDHISESNF